MTGFDEEYWREWRIEREGILIYDGGASEKDAVAYTRVLEQLEKLRLTMESQKED